MKPIQLRDCCDLFSGGTPTKGKAVYWNGMIPWFSPKDFRTFDLKSSQLKISEIAVEESATRLIDSGTILVVGRSGVLAHTLPVGIVRQPSTFNQDVKAIVPHDGYDAEFLAYCLLANQSLILKEGVKRGPTVHSLVSGFVEKLPVPDISFLQQCAVALRIRQQLAAAEAARIAAANQLLDIKALPQRILASVFEM